MKIQNFQPTARTEVKDAPEWLDRFLDPIYKQIDLLTQMGQSRIAVGDNLNQEFLQVRVRHDTDIDVGLQLLKGKPRGVTPVQLVPQNLDAMGVQYDFTWKILDEKRIRIRVKFAAGTTVNFADLTVIAVGD